jgi:alpha-galactosidase
MHKIITEISSVNTEHIYDARIKEMEILTPALGAAPKINKPDIYGARTDKPFIYRVPCTGKRPMRFFAECLPESLEIDAEKGIITGRTPVDVGEYTVTLHVSNDEGCDSMEWTLIVGDNLALTPPMGWNHWYTHYHLVTDEKIRAATDAMVSSGMADVGYQYIGIDDCWMRITEEDAKLSSTPERKAGCYNLNFDSKVGPVRDEYGTILSAHDFPDMKSLADYIHSYGLKAGIYTSPGKVTCQFFEAAYGHELHDAKTFAKWGYDLLKYDMCSYRKIWELMKGDEQINRSYPFKLMGGILEHMDRDIVFNICEYGYHVWEWGKEAGGHFWRVGGDLGHTVTEGGFYEIAKKTIELRDYNGPGRWNDPDYLILGKWTHPLIKDGQLKPVDLTANEQYSYFSLWAMLACPLCFSGDMEAIDDFTYNVLCNTEMISVNQDRLGLCAEPVRMQVNEWVLKKTLADGSIVVGFFNISAKGDREIKVKWSELGLEDTKKTRDLWRQKDVGEFDDELTVHVGPCGSAVIQLK